MISAGIDSGAKNIKAVIIRDGAVIAKSIVPAGTDARASCGRAYDQALSVAGLTRVEVQKVLATGVGKKLCDFAQGEATEVSADAQGVRFMMPQVRTVVDVGAEEGRAVRINEQGNVVDFTINDKCAAGTGIFIEAVARALETRVEDMAELSEQAKKEIIMNAQCAVFAESELVSLIHSEVAKADIVRAVLTAIADRTISMMRRVGIEKEVALIGGVALNKGFVKAIERELNIKIAVPTDPQFIGAIGAAVAAAG